MWVSIMHGAGGSVNSVPSGWVQHGTTITIGSQTHRLYKKIASGEGASWTWGFTGSITNHSQAISFSGVDNTNPVSASAQQGSPGLSTTITHASISPPDAACMLVTFSGSDSSSTWTAAGTMTERTDARQGSNSCQIATQQLTASGATGTRAHTASVVSDMGGHIIALKPSAPNAGTLDGTEAQDTFAGVGTFLRWGTLTAVETQDASLLWNPHNIAAYSEQLDNAYWNKRSGLTVVADNTTAPDGTTTADRLVWASGDGYLWRTILTNAYRPGVSYTVSAWAKVAAGSPTLQFHADWAGGSPTNVTSSVISPTSSWVRYEFTFTTSSPTGGGGDAGFYIVSGELYLWGVQLVFGDTALPYAKTEGTNYPVPTGVVVAGTLTPAEVQDVAAFDGNARHTGTMAVTEIGDGLIAYGNHAKHGTLAATEAQDAFASSGNAKHYGTLAATEAKDTAAFTGNTRHHGTLAGTEAQDVAALTGSVTPYHFGALAATEAKDAFAGTGSAYSFKIGTLAATEAQDDLDAFGTVTGIGTMSALEAQDVFAGVGTHTHLGTFAATEAQDVFACLAQVVRHTGTLSVVEQADIGLFAGQARHHGVLAVTEAPDTFASSGDVLQVQGTLDATDEQDVALFVGQQLQVNGPLDVTEAQDAFAGDGLANGVRYGVLDATEAQDAFYAVGYSYGLTAGLPDAVAKAEGQQLSVEVEPEFDLTAEIPTLDLAADVQTLTGDASATPQSALRYSVVDLVINQLYSAIMPFNPVYRDVVDVGDDVVVSFDHAFTESVHALDTIAIDRARTSTEAVVALDAYALAVVWVRLFSEKVAVQDAIHVLAPSGSIFSDSVFVAELMARAVAIQRGDPVPIADHTSAALIPRPSETASATDAMSRVVAYRRTFSDVAVMVEQMAIATTKLLTTPVSVADQKLGGWGKALADNLFTADVQHRVLGKGLADGPTVTDASSVSVAFRRTFSDVVFATDIFSTITNDLIQLSDSVTMSDARMKTLTKPHIESVTLTDGRALSFGKRAADTVALASAGTIVGQGYANNYFAQDYVSGTLATFT